MNNYNYTILTISERLNVGPRRESQKWGEGLTVVSLIKMLRLHADIVRFEILKLSGSLYQFVR